MIRSLFLPNDCKDGSERLEPAAGCLSGGPEADDCFSAVWTAGLELMCGVSQVAERG